MEGGPSVLWQTGLLSISLRLWKLAVFHKTEQSSAFFFRTLWVTWHRRFFRTVDCPYGDP